MGQFNGAGLLKWPFFLCAAGAILLAVGAAFTLLALKKPPLAVQAQIAEMKRDYPQAAALYARLIEEEPHNSAGYFFLGALKMQNKGVPYDCHGAIALWEKGLEMATDSGVGRIHLTLGMCRLNGRGVQQDYVRARDHFLKADDPDADYELGVLYQTGHGVTADSALAFTYFKKAADHPVFPNAEAACQVGLAYLNGDGTAPSDENALAAFNKAMEKGSARGANHYGRMLLIGRGTVKDPAGAFKAFGKAAEKNDPEGCFNLAGCYAYGFGVEKSVDSARVLLEKSASRGFEDARQLLDALPKSDSAETK